MRWSDITSRWSRAALLHTFDGDPAPTEPARVQHAFFGDYELLEILGRGASGTVYRARQRSLSRVVALKIMSGVGRSRAAEVQRFHFGAQAAAELEHPNIAPIYEVGTHEGIPFVSMRLLEGGTLADACERLQRSQVGVAKLMAKVAHAVHHAHQRGVLHRDLKPANIVLDEHDEPFVVDFGFAKHLDERARCSTPSVIVGTLGYMAPEQAGCGASRSLTFAADIFALGAIMYELLTGEVPFNAPSLGELFANLACAEPARAPRSLVSTLDRDLERVCLKCLEKDPARRYATAAELARDLESWLDFRPISLRPERGAARAWRWCHAHPALATVVTGAAFVLAAATAVTASIAHEYEQLHIHDVLKANSYAAQSKAGEVLAQLRELANPLARCAADARIATLLTTPLEVQAEPLRADRLLLECGAKTVFDSITLVSLKGDELARLPRRERRAESWQALHRDFFEGASQLAESGYRAVHVGKVVQPDDDDQRYVSLSAPVFDADNRWLGLVHAMVQMTAFLDSLRLLDSGSQMALLAGVEEPSPLAPATHAKDDGGMVLLHDVLGSARAQASENSWLDELNLRRRDAGRNPFRTSDARHHSLEDNPAAHTMTSFGKRWLAGFAPVGHTGYAVVVQTQYDAATEAVRRALWRLIGGSSAVLVLGAGGVFALARALQQRSRARRV